MGLDFSGGTVKESPYVTYNVVITTHDAMPSSYKGVLSVFVENGFLELWLPERRIYVNLNNVNTYSVRRIEAGQQTDNVREIPAAKKRPEATPADDFPGGESA